MYILTITWNLFTKITYRLTPDSDICHTCSICVSERLLDFIVVRIYNPPLRSGSTCPPYSKGLYQLISLVPVLFYEQLAT